MIQSQIPCCWTVVGVVTAAAVFAQAAACEGQSPKMLLKPVDMSQTALTAKQQTILERVENAKGRVRSVEVQVLASNTIPTMDKREPMLLPLPGRREALELKDYTFEDSKGTNSKTLRFKDGKVASVLILTGDAWHGLIYVQDQTYSLQPLGKGLHAISLIDQSALVDEK